MGSKYDRENILDLTRFLYPKPPAPKKLSSKSIGIAAGDPTRAICSSLVAEAFKEIGHQILQYTDES